MHVTRLVNICIYLITRNKFTTVIFQILNSLKNQSLNVFVLFYCYCLTINYAHLTHESRIYVIKYHIT